jgi:polyribonucleotide nucleotidyltransferase
MIRFIPNSVFGVFFASTFLFFSASAFADITEQAQEILDRPNVQCAKELAPEIKNLLHNEIKNARSACKELRGCKQAARAEKKECKQNCKDLKGKAKRQCNKECRQESRSDKKSCRDAYKSTECKAARRKIVGGTLKAIIQLAKNEQCRKALENLQQLK